MIKVVPVQQLQDNYAYIVTDGKYTAFVDPVEPEKVIQTCKTDNISMANVTILTTHHHADHSGGNVNAKLMFPEVQVVGGDERIPAMTHKVQHKEQFMIGDMHITALHTPCHTTGHICYRVQANDKDAGHVFTGDTLFVGGCGKFFEGTAQQMHDSLETIGKLPKETQVWVGHEYTKSNLVFCQSIEPENAAIREEMLRCTPGRISVPSTIGNEWEWNVFMRVADPKTGILQKLKEEDPVRGLAKYVLPKEG
jgi:hydroxyacylglutathione hydrolase